MSLFNKVQNIIFEKNDLQEKRREDGSIIKKFQDSTSRPDYDNLSGKQKEQLQNIINNNNQSSKNDYEKDAKKYRKLKNYQKFKKFTTSAMGKIVGKTRLGTGARVIGAIAAVKGYDMLKKTHSQVLNSNKSFHVYLEERCIFKNLNQEEFDIIWERLYHSYWGDVFSYTEIDIDPTTLIDSSY